MNMKSRNKIVDQKIKIKDYEDFRKRLKQIKGVMKIQTPKTQVYAMIMKKSQDIFREEQKKELLNKNRDFIFRLGNIYTRKDQSQNHIEKNEFRPINNSMRLRKAISNNKTQIILQNKRLVKRLVTVESSYKGYNPGGRKLFQEQNMSEIENQQGNFFVRNNKPEGLLTKQQRVHTESATSEYMRKRSEHTHSLSKIIHKRAFSELQKDKKVQSSTKKEY